MNSLDRDTLLQIAKYIGPKTGRSLRLASKQMKESIPSNMFPSEAVSQLKAALKDIKVKRPRWMKKTFTYVRPNAWYVKVWYNDLTKQVFRIGLANNFVQDNDEVVDYMIHVAFEGEVDIDTSSDAATKRAHVAFKTAMKWFVQNGFKFTNSVEVYNDVLKNVKRSVHYTKNEDQLMINENMLKSLQTSQMKMTIRPKKRAGSQESSDDWPWTHAVEWIPLREGWRIYVQNERFEAHFTSEKEGAGAAKSLTITQKQLSTNLTHQEAKKVYNAIMKRVHEVDKQQTHFDFEYGANHYFSSEPKPSIGGKSMKSRSTKK